MDQVAQGAAIRMRKRVVPWQIYGSAFCSAPMLMASSDNRRKIPCQRKSGAVRHLRRQHRVRIPTHVLVLEQQQKQHGDHH